MAVSIVLIMIKLRKLFLMLQAPSRLLYLLFWERVMDMNSVNENSKGTRGVVSIIGLVIVVIGMVASVQADGSFMPDIVMALGTIIILVAEKAAINESAHK